MTTREFKKRISELADRMFDIASGRYPEATDEQKARAQELGDKLIEYHAELVRRSFTENTKGYAAARTQLEKTINKVSKAEGDLEALVETFDAVASTLNAIASLVKALA